MRLVSGLLNGVAKALLFLVVALCLAVTIVPPFLDTRYYEGPQSSHFDGAHFFNPNGDTDFGAPPGQGRQGFLLRWLTGSSGRPSWPDAIAVKPARPPVVSAPGAMRATWVGHATVLIQADGINILTDPTWSDYASPLPPFGPKRIAAPGIRFEDLPKIDLVLVSHNHYDHLDLPTLERLWKRDRPAIVTSLGNDALLKANGIPARGLDWGQSVTGAALNGTPGWDVTCESYRHCPRYTVHVTRSHHWGSRWGTDRNRALWSSFVVETGAGNIFFAGDTGMGDGKWPEEAAKIGPIRLAVIPIGAFRFWPGQMESDAHIGPRAAVEVFRRLHASTAIPIHWGTFHLSYEKWDTPPRMLDLFLQCGGIARKRFAPLRIGQSIDVPPYAASDSAARPTIDPVQCRGGPAALAKLE
jgi:L-ascorbate metabolism protein UlaG (beta-lactamase superfamily)